jgi:exopolyphosphatase/guanosine-5'-triphosphate,3'-diphosphate pyrophosphatase
MFALSMVDLESKIGAAANVSVFDSSEVYLLGARDDLNVKVRNGTLDLKRLDQTDENGLELWRPAGKERFPVSAEGAAKLLAPFGLNFTFQGAIAVEAFLSHAVASGLQIIDVKKSRRSFSYRGCLAEFSEIAANGRTRQSFCIESEDREVLLAALKDLNLPPKANVNFPRGLKQEFGLSEAHRT